MGKCVAAVQMGCAVGRIEENTERVIRLLKNLYEREPELTLAVFPEMCLYGYDDFGHIPMKCPQEMLERSLKRIGKVCVDKGFDVVVGAPYYGSRGVENGLYYLSKTGKIQHVYSKCHCIDAERPYIKEGDVYGICQTPLGKAGFLICWDAGFAEAARLYAKSGVDFLIVSAAWEIPYERQWDLAVGGRSFDNDLPVIASNRIGRDGTVEFFGDSSIFDGLGNRIAGAGFGREGWAVINVEDFFDRSGRKNFGSQMKELREETYTEDAVKYYD